MDTSDVRFVSSECDSMRTSICYSRYSCSFAESPSIELKKAIFMSIAQDGVHSVKAIKLLVFLLFVDCTRLIRYFQHSLIIYHRQINPLLNQCYGIAFVTKNFTFVNFFRGVFLLLSRTFWDNIQM